MSLRSWASEAGRWIPKATVAEHGAQRGSCLDRMWDAFRLEEAWREVDSSRRCTRDAQTPINALVKPQVINLGQSRPVAGHPMHAQCHRLKFRECVCVWNVQVGLNRGKT